MSILDDLLNEGHAAAESPAPSMSDDTAALLGRTPASAERTPAPPDGAAADVAALTGKSPAPQPVSKLQEALKYGVDLANKGIDKAVDLGQGTSGLVRNPTTHKWEVAPEEEHRPWYKRLADDAGAAYDEGLPWLKRKAGEALDAVPAAVSGVGHGVTAGLAPNIVSEFTNLGADLEDVVPFLKQGGEGTQRTTAGEVQAEHQKRADEHPVGDFIGDSAGSALLAALTGPGAGTRAIAGQIGGKGAQTAARLGGDTLNSVAQYVARNITNTNADEPWKKRISEGTAAATDDPLSLVLAAGLPTAVSGVAKAGANVAKGLKNASQDAFSHLFMPASERALIRKTGGDEAVRKIVQETQDAGILGGMLPTAGSVANRAGAVIKKVGPGIGSTLEDLLTAADKSGTPADTSELLKTLYGMANHLRSEAFRGKAPKEAAMIEETIHMIENGGLAGQPGKMALRRAVHGLKDFQANTGYDPTVTAREPIEQKINMTGWKGLKDATKAAFDDLERGGHVPPGTVDKYKDLQKRYHVAERVHYPALQVAEKVAQVSAKDPGSLLGTAVLGGQFGQPAAIGVSLGGVPRGLQGRGYQAASGVAKGISKAGEAAEAVRFPQAMSAPIARFAKERNEDARSEIRRKREQLARTASAYNDLEDSTGVKIP